MLFLMFQYLVVNFCFIINPQNTNLPVVCFIQPITFMDYSKKIKENYKGANYPCKRKKGI